MGRSGRCCKSGEAWELRLPAGSQTGLTELAVRTTRPDAQVARRVDALLSSGAFYLDMDIAAELLGFGTSAMLYFTVAPAALSAVGQELANHPETAFLAAVTGPANLTASLLCKDLEHLYDYLTTRIAAIAAIHSGSRAAAGPSRGRSALCRAGNRGHARGACARDRGGTQRAGRMPRDRRHRTHSQGT